MKTPLIYGLGIAFAMAVLSLVSHILGLSTNPEKMLLGFAVGLASMLIICITGIVLGTKAVRAAVPPTAGFTYGQAFKAGVLIAVFAGLGSAIYNFVYFSFIFPNFADVQMEGMRMMFEKMNMPPSRIDEALEKARLKATVFAQVRGALIFTIIFGALISLVTSAFLKRAPVEDLGAPPPIA